MKIGVLLLAPFFLLRFGLLSLVNKAAVGRAAYFAPMPEREKAAYWIYQVSNLLLLLFVLFSKVQAVPPLLYGGAALYAAGLLLLAASVMAFAHPAEDGFSRTGVYRLSRNPMYAAYFLYFLGCSMLARSWLSAAVTLIFQVSAHWVIRAEERWCVQQYGDAYKQYMQKVRRYI